MAIYCGIDWAEGHHDIALIDSDGGLVAKRRINESLDGVAEFTAMLAAAGDRAEDLIPVAIETPRGLLVAVLRATGRTIYPINPLAVARYRERTSLSGKKSDHLDAMDPRRETETLPARQPYPAAALVLFWIQASLTSYSLRTPGWRHPAP